MKIFSTLLCAAALALAAPALAQQETPPDTTGTEVQAPETPAEPETATEPETAAEPADEPAEPTHDWEFALAPTERAQGAAGIVQVTDQDGTSAFVVTTSDLPIVDSLDQEGRDVNAYTVWVVPSKDRVPESTFAGVLTLDPETREGTLEATTDLATFGVIVTATADGAPERIGGVPVLTGIPVQPQAQPEPETGEAPQPETPEAPGTPETPEGPEIDEPAGNPDAEPGEPAGPGDQPNKDAPETEPEVDPTTR